MIEACEKLYRDTTKRVATEQIGLARVREGLDLVRIGKPIFPEYAGWRYGSRFLYRHSRAMVASTLGATGVLVGVAVATSPALVIWGGGAATWLAWQAWNSASRRATDRKTIGTVQLLDGRVEILHVRRARRARIAPGPDGRWTVALPEFPGKIIRAVIEDEPTEEELLDHVGPAMENQVFDLVSPLEAAETLRRIMPTINEAGGDELMVHDAVRLHEQWGGRITESIAELLAYQGKSVVLSEEPHLSLALEMSVYEDQERRWLEGELYLLEAMWQEAEEVAAIADNLTLPEWVADKLGSLRGAPK